jgi:hypothetical protein
MDWAVGFCIKRNVAGCEADCPALLPHLEECDVQEKHSTSHSGAMLLIGVKVVDLRATYEPATIKLSDLASLVHTRTMSRIM